MTPVVVTSLEELTPEQRLARSRLIDTRWEICERCAQRFSNWHWTWARCWLSDKDGQGKPTLEISADFEGYENGECLGFLDGPETRCPAGYWIGVEAKTQEELDAEELLDEQEAIRKWVGRREPFIKRVVDAEGKPDAVEMKAILDELVALAPPLKLDPAKRDRILVELGIT